MVLPEPTLSFTIPSIHDDTTLDCRLYLPRRSSVLRSEKEKRYAAIVAHPYAPLGGCYDDPVVGVAVSEILREGFVVCTFNFRWVIPRAMYTWAGVFDTIVEVLEAPTATQVGPERPSKQIMAR
jgi:hypothetical protein